MKSIIIAVGLAVISPANPSEQSWAIRQTAADIQEMAGKVVAEADLSGLTPWTADDRMIAFATTQLGPGRGTVEDALPDQYPALVEATPAQLFAASDEVSKALKRNMRSPRAHEAAAIVLGAFGLQEAADEFSDHRWVMNRMTAHLAVAAALRGRGAPMGVDGQLAAAVLATLANRQAAALETIARIGDTQAASPKGAWQRALTLRIRRDCSVLKAPAAATRLEKLEYFRARRATLPDRRAGHELQELSETATADFSRILQSSATSVEDGNQFVANSIVRELSEFAKVYQRAFKRPMPAPLPGEINACRLRSTIQLPSGETAPSVILSSFSAGEPVLRGPPTRSNRIVVALRSSAGKRYRDTGPDSPFVTISSRPSEVTSNASASWEPSGYVA